jgi:acyl-coenzyme A thioesterase PaaI-like protein
MCVITNKQKDADIAERRQLLVEMRNRHHEKCHVCSMSNKSGLRAEFNVCKNGEVEALIICEKTKEGYEDIVHGGIVASLLDGSMTNCLFSYGIAAVTGEITTRILHSVTTHAPIAVRARLEENRAPLYLLSAEISQSGRISAKAKGKFVNKTYIRRKK